MDATKSLLNSLYILLRCNVRQTTCVWKVSVKYVKSSFLPTCNSHQRSSRPTQILHGNSITCRLNVEYIEWRIGTCPNETKDVWRSKMSVIFEVFFCIRLKMRISYSNFAVGLLFSWLYFWRQAYYFHTHYSQKVFCIYLRSVEVGLQLQSQISSQVCHIQVCTEEDSRYCSAKKATKHNICIEL